MPSIGFSKFLQYYYITNLTEINVDLLVYTEDEFESLKERKTTSTGVSAGVVFL